MDQAEVNLLVPGNWHQRYRSQLALKSCRFQLTTYLALSLDNALFITSLSLEQATLIQAAMARPVKALSPRGRVAVIAGSLIALLFVLHIVFPSSLSTTQRRTSVSSSVIRSKFLRAKAKDPRPPIHHPIPKLMADAREAYETKVNSQSKTLGAAVKEYRRRYNRDPPKGFDIWFEFATANNTVMIDEYDQLVRDLEPFWQLTGAEIRQRCIDVGYLPSVDLVRIQDGKTHTIDVSKGFDDSEVGARAKGFRVMLEKFLQYLPDMDFPINEKAEGRILIPWEERLYKNLTADASSKSP